MENELKASLLRVAEVYAGATGLKLSTVGMRAVRDARFFAGLEEGRGFTARTYDRVMIYFSGQWPDGLAWPDGVDRPEPGPVPDPASKTSLPVPMLS